MKKIYSVNKMSELKFSFEKPCIVFLKGDLGAGKTTLSKYILQNILGIKADITSPTYTYYNKYDDHYHFDLYRLKDYDEFFAIGGEDILDNHTGVVLIEWPELLEAYYKPDFIITLSKIDKDNEREIELIKK